MVLKCLNVCCVMFKYVNHVKMPKCIKYRFALNWHRIINTSINYVVIFPLLFDTWSIIIAWFISLKNERKNSKKKKKIESNLKFISKKWKESKKLIAVRLFSWDLNLCVLMYWIKSGYSHLLTATFFYSLLKIRYR